MERRSRRPDSPDTCHATVRAADRRSGADTRGSALCRRQVFRRPHDLSGAGQRSAAAVRGLVFLGFPLHPPGQPSESRAQHLVGVQVPMLFLQGTHDDFAKLDLIEPIVARLGDRAELKLSPGRRSFLPCTGAIRSDRRRGTRRPDAYACDVDRFSMIGRRMTGQPERSAQSARAAPARELHPALRSQPSVVHRADFPDRAVSPPTRTESRPRRTVLPVDVRAMVLAKDRSEHGPCTVIRYASRIPVWTASTFLPSERQPS